MGNSFGSGTFCGAMAAKSWPRPWGYVAGGGSGPFALFGQSTVTLTPLSCQDQDIFVAWGSLRAITCAPFRY
jgi:hypothetical protein